MTGRTAREEKHIAPPGSMSEPGGAPSVLEYLFRLELQRSRIDAVAQAGRPGPVRENMAEMAAAFGAEHLGADHAVAQIVLFVDMALGGRLGKARPAAAGIEFGIGLEQHIAAAGADVSAGAVVVLIFA